MAPSSDQVAAIMGSMYCHMRMRGQNQQLELRRTYFSLWRCSLGLAGQLNDLVETRHAGWSREQREVERTDGDPWLVGDLR